mmetsp:Transcript_15025/g.22526  ORF Transcript_15025/g.22526 Transcript_15025/m.22526 type:complete len:194 (-) Transcript_15025:1129-1710(-)
MHAEDRKSDIDTSRRSVFASALAAYSVIASPFAANAVYGADANIQMPNVAQGMADRLESLVESLGTRECLVYEDPANKLYKSVDSKILFERLGASVEALKRLPNYITNKQWSNVQSVLTGPMGSLSYNMNELVKLIDEDNPLKSQCKDLTGNIRKDLYGISAAIANKDGTQALMNYERATEKMETFVKLVSSV